MTQDRPVFVLPRKEKPHIKKAIKILNNFQDDIPYIDKDIEYLIVIIQRGFGERRTIVQNKHIHRILSTEDELMKP